MLSWCSFSKFCYREMPLWIIVFDGFKHCYWWDCFFIFNPLLLGKTLCHLISLESLYFPISFLFSLINSCAPNRSNLIKFLYKLSKRIGIHWLHLKIHGCNPLSWSIFSMLFYMTMGHLYNFHPQYLLPHHFPCIGQIIQLPSYYNEVVVDLDYELWFPSSIVYQC